MSEPRPVRTTADGRPRGPEAVELLFGLMDRMREDFGAVAADFDLTPQQAVTLHQLPDEGRPMRELAMVLRCDASNITGIGDRLEAAGLVERRTSETDRRVKALAPTEQGRRVRDELGARVAELPPIAALSPEEQRTLVWLMRKMVSPPPGTLPGT
jgi:DNA-binding MarR family transcriptional regulator